jgi:hypothetical protein
MPTTVPFRAASRARVLAGAAALATTALVALGASVAGAGGPNVGFAFHARDVAGAPAGVVRLNGGGAFRPGTDFVRAGGGFRCTTAVNQGPLAGCATGDGAHWKAAALLASSPFKCTGAAGELAKTANTDDETAVVRADFFRAGDGNFPAFTANVIVSTRDIAPDIDGHQNVWVQGVGCATALSHFGS